VQTTAVDFVIRQQQNRRRSLLLLAGVLAVFLALGLAVDAVWTGTVGGGWPVPVVTVVAAGVGGVTGLMGYFRGADLVLRSLLARPVRADVPAQREFTNVVTEMALAAGLPRPGVFVIPDTAPNALAAGRDPQHAVVAVTQGLLNLLDRAELQGVVAHEMAHIGNRDTLTMTLVGVLLGGALMLADWARRVMYIDRGRKTHPLLIVLVFALLLVTPLLSRLLAMAVSRQREYLADATAVQFTRNPLGLASALEKIGAAPVPLRRATRGTAHLFISNPWPRRLDDRQGAVADLFSTHPPLAQRIAVLRAMARVA
jgi:heat shock protein HtpX